MKKSPRCSSNGTAGFTLVEIGVVVAILGVLVSIAIPGYKKITERSTNTVMSNDFRAVTGALEHYALEQGSWPPDGGGGWPAELTGYLPPPDRWNRPTPIGGKWSWALDGDDAVAAVRISNFTAPISQLLKLDAMIDDGSIETGTSFVTGTTLVYALEK
jgi:prepilin-type N-terminal cleavage/methylation domain-containing protein